MKIVLYFQLHRETIGALNPAIKSAASKRAVLIAILAWLLLARRNQRFVMAMESRDSINRFRAPAALTKAAISEIVWPDNGDNDDNKRRGQRERSTEGRTKWRRVEGWDWHRRNTRARTSRGKELVLLEMQPAPIAEQTPVRPYVSSRRTPFHPTPGNVPWSLNDELHLSSPVYLPRYFRAVRDTFFSPRPRGRYSSLFEASLIEGDVCVGAADCDASKCGWKVTVDNWGKLEGGCD